MESFDTSKEWKSLAEHTLLREITNVEERLRHPVWQGQLTSEDEYMKLVVQHFFLIAKWKEMHEEKVNLSSAA